MVLLGFLAAILGALAAWFLFWRRPWWGLVLTTLSIVPGQLIRLSLGPRGSTALLLLDLLVAALVTAWLLGILLRARKWPQTALNLPLGVFLGLALVSYLHGALVLADATVFELKEFVIGGLYLGRLALYSLGFFAVRDWLAKKGEGAVRSLWAWLVAAALLVAVAGFIQYIVYPDFTDMAVAYGWDPHIGRLLSTWFDPNFVGGFLALMATIVLSLLLPKQSWRQRLTWGGIFLVLIAALMLTYSRSGYLALAVGLTVLGVFQARRILLGMLVLGIVLVGVFPRALDRVTEGFNFDATAEKRVVSWQNGLSVLARYPLLGTGYNLIGPVQDEMGLLTEFDINNRAGFENSLLTIVVATGLPGLLAYLWLWLAVLQLAFRLGRAKNLSSWGRAWSFGVGAGLVGLLVHSFFLNSLLFVLILWPLMLLWAGLDNLRMVAEKGGDGSWRVGCGEEDGVAKVDWGADGRRRGIRKSPRRGAPRAFLAVRTGPGGPRSVGSPTVVLRWGEHRTSQYKFRL